MKTRILLFITLAAMVLLAACKGKSGPYEFVNNSKIANDDSARVGDTTPSTPKLVKTAEMHFKVRNVQRAKDSIISLTKLYGGMVMHHQVQSSAEQSKDLHISNDSIQRISVFSTNADMTVKIPSEKLEEFMTKVGHMGLYVNISRMDIEDKSLDYLSSQLKLNSRKELISQQKKGKVIIKDPSSVLYLKDDLVDEQIDNRKIDDAVKYSVISLNFYQSNTISTENIANDDPSAYNVPLFQRLGMAFGNGWNIFIDVMVGLANLWVFIIAGTVLWRGIVYYKRRSRTINTPVA